MKKHEIIRLLGDPFIPLLNSKARRDLAQLVKGTKNRPAQILDVGGRRSPYSVGLTAQITIVDIPRESEIQQKLNLGLTDQIMADVRQERSNIQTIILEDMTQSTLASQTFDGVICVEVIEHVPDDHAFVQQIARVLKSGGWLYLTTPNGDFVKNEPPHYNPDHIRHYTRQELQQLMNDYFADVTITYGIKISKHFRRGLRGVSFKRPLFSLTTMANNVINHWESRHVADQAEGTAHLFVVARKK